MLKTAIAGGETPDAGELLRLLVNHPEVDLITVYSPSLKGSRLSAVHYGLIGETEMTFSDILEPEKIDVLFICSTTADFPSFEELSEINPDLKIIDMTRERKFGEIPYGLSEINRKELVRGAKHSVLASAEGASALIALYPMGCKQLLHPGLSITIATSGTPDITHLADEIMSRLTLVQSSLVTVPEIKIKAPVADAIVEAEVEYASTLSVADAIDIFESVYDDHNFTFVLDQKVKPEEVRGTNKCIVSISNPLPGKLKVSAMLDGKIRGGAGGAIHIFNLLCGLHEKTGLSLSANY